METTAYIESGVLELYVFGILPQDEMDEVTQMAEKHPAIKEEIVSIEKAVISLSFSMSPYLSAANYDKIRQQLLEKHGEKVVRMDSGNRFVLFLGWAAAVLLMVGTYYFWDQNQASQNTVVTLSTEKEKMKGEMDNLKLQNQTTESLLSVVRDENNVVVPLAGQTVDPSAKAKIYWNKNTQAVYVDASGLPEPPKGKVYQVWALQLSPQLVPTSIGLLEKFGENGHKLFAVSNAIAPQGFGITLEPDGGSATPTMEQLYTLGAMKV